MSASPHPQFRHPRTDAARGLGNNRAAAKAKGETSVCIRHAWPVLACLMLWAGLACPAWAAQAPAAGACPPSQALSACVAAVRGRDPAAAVRLGEPAWQAGGQGPEHTALGLELVDAAAKAGQADKVAAIGTALLGQGALSPPQRLRLLTQLNGAIWQAHDASRIAALEAETATLEQQLPQGPEVADLWRRLAVSYYQIGAQDDALRMARLALSKAGQGPSLAAYKANQIVFAVSAQQGRIPDAIAALLEAERINQALGRPADAELLVNATGVFLYAREWDKAIDYGTRALAAYDTAPVHGLARSAVLNNLGAAYEGADQLPRAEAIFSQALAAARREGKDVPVGELNNLAHVLRRLHRPQEALSLLREAAAGLQGSGENGTGGVVHSNIGAALVDLGERRAAAVEFARSRALFAQSDNVPRRLELYPRMIDNLEALGRTGEALAWMREYKAVNDQAVNVESKTRIAALESAVDLEHKQAELAALGRARIAEQAEYSQLQAREQRQRITLYGLLAALLALAAFFAWKLREGRKRRRINAELARKNQEIQTQHHALEELTAVIRRQSEEDALTGLRNRRYVQGWIQAREAAWARGAAREPLLVGLLDIDHFKRVNDLHGHEGGDQALIHLAQLLAECARSSDVVARWGGEEFLWLCPGGTLADVPALFRRLHARLHGTPLLRPGGAVVLSVSMGASLFPAQPGGDWPLSLRIADAALYRAKDAGRDRWVALALSEQAVIVDEAGSPRSFVQLEAQGALQQSSGTGHEAAASVQALAD